MRDIPIELPEQELLTADLKTIILSAVAYYAIIDPVLSVINITDSHLAVKLLCMSILRDSIGITELNNLQRDKKMLENRMQVS